jgi:predicted transporter
MLHLFNAILGLSTMALAVSLGFALHLSGPLRHEFSARLPESMSGPISTMFSSFWMVVGLLFVGGFTRLLYAFSGHVSMLSIAGTGMVTALSLYSCWAVATSAWRLHRSVP